MKIVADTPTLYSPAEGLTRGMTIIPSCAIIDGCAYRDFVDIDTDDFLRRVAAGAVPTTSQPSIGDILEIYESCNEEILVLPIGDGLSGTYQNMAGARNFVEDKERIHVVDTKTLAGPQRYLVNKALRLREQGMAVGEIVKALEENIESSASFVIPADFDFLKRSGRLTPVAAKLGTVLKIVPVLTQTKDMKRITLFTVKRSKKKALAAIVDHFKAMGVDERYLITVSHGGAEEEAKLFAEQLGEQFEHTEIEVFPLVPSLVSHGGPGCIVVQTIMK